MEGQCWWLEEWVSRFIGPGKAGKCDSWKIVGAVLHGLVGGGVMVATYSCEPGIVLGVVPFVEAGELETLESAGRFVADGDTASSAHLSVRVVEDLM